MTPKHYLSKALREITESISIGVPSYIIKESEGGVNQLLVINLKDICAEGISPDTLTSIPAAQDQNFNRFKVAAGDVLVAARGTKFKAALAGTEVSGAIAAANLITVRPGKELYPPFLAAYLTSAAGEKQVLARAKATTASQLLINVSDIEELEIPLPPLEVQKKIGDLWQELKAQQKRYNEAANLCSKISNQIITDAISNLVKEGNDNE